jgi:hypothetical protein
MAKTIEPPRDIAKERAARMADIQHDLATDWSDVIAIAEELRQQGFKPRSYHSTAGDVQRALTPAQLAKVRKVPWGDRTPEQGLARLVTQLGNRAAAQAAAGTPEEQSRAAAASTKADESLATEGEKLLAQINVLQREYNALRDTADVLRREHESRQAAAARMLSDECTPDHILVEERRQRSQVKQRIATRISAAESDLYTARFVLSLDIQHGGIKVRSQRTSSGDDLERHATSASEHYDCAIAFATARYPDRVRRGLGLSQQEQLSPAAWQAIQAEYRDALPRLEEQLSQLVAERDADYAAIAKLRETWPNQYT